MADSCARVTDGNLRRCIDLLPHLPPMEVEVDVHCDPPTSLLPALTRHKCKKMLLWYPFRHPDPKFTGQDQLMKEILSKSGGLVEYAGWVNEGMFNNLTSTTTKLWLSVATYTQSLTLPRLYSFAGTLDKLHVTVHRDMSPVPLEPLPDVDNPFGSQVVLYLPGVLRPEVSTACRLARALQPSGGYRSIHFPGAKASKTNLLRQLVAYGVSVDDKVVLPSIDAHDMYQLTILAKEMGARCGVERYDFKSEGW